jgi:hypothetical protein
MADKIALSARRCWHLLDKRVHGRLAGWSILRRWLVLVALPVLLCCGGTVGGLPVWWATSETLDAGRGEASPTAAATVYVLALGYGDDAPLPLLYDEAQGNLTRQWLDLRTAMAATEGGGPSRLNMVDMRVGAVAGGRAVVEVDVSATWWGRGGSPNTSLESSAHTWRIETIEDDGWRVTAVHAPPWCGADGYVVRCPDDLSPVPTPVPDTSSVSPSANPLAELLPCGERDPFKNMPGRRRSCPPS